MKGLTEVVFTPHSSNFSNVGVGALGVSMNSNSLSEPLMLWGLEDMTTFLSIELSRSNLDNPVLVGEGEDRIVEDVSSLFVKPKAVCSWPTSFMSHGRAGLGFALPEAAVLVRTSTEVKHIFPRSSKNRK